MHGIGIVVFVFVVAGPPIEIHSVEDLDMVRANPDGDFVLMQDLVVGQIEPIGNASQPFTGTFNGHGHTLSNLSIDSPDADNVGLFGLVDGGSIRNLTVANATVTGRRSVGALVGRLQNSNVRNCSSSGTVTGTEQWAGGLIGHIHIDCLVTRSQSSAAVSGVHVVGGLAGNHHASVMVKCSASGPVSGDRWVGGLIGYVQNNPNPSTVARCTASGAVSAGTTGDWAGGLIGFVEANTSILNCHADGDVDGEYYVGGLLGEVASGSQVERCSASGHVLSHYNFIGGLIGKSDGATVRRCWSTGDVDTSTGPIAGGLIGIMTATTVEDCYCRGSVADINGAPVQQMGGLVGNATGGSEIRRCYTTGTLTNSLTHGAIAGYISFGMTIEDCHWDQEASAEPEGCGSSSCGGASGHSTAAMQQRATYAGWNFNRVWRLNEGADYPTLRVFALSNRVAAVPSPPPVD